MAHGLAVTGSFMLAVGVGQGVAAAQAGSSVISGTVFNDLDGDGVRQPGEPGIGAVGIQLRDAEGFFVGSTSTSPNGSYSFTGLDPGTYRVVQLANAPGYSVDTTPNELIVNVFDEASGVDFGDARADGESDSSVQVTGVVFVDADGDGTFDGGEVGATETRVLIADEDYDPIIWLHPDADGTLTWEGDVGGPVVIRALPPDGWEGTTELVAWADPGEDNTFAFGVAPPAPATTTTLAPPTTIPNPSGTTPGGSAQDPGRPATTTTTRAANVPINAALAPVPDDPTPRTTSTTISLEVAGAQARRLAATGRASGDNAGSAAWLIAGGSATLAASFVMRRWGRPVRPTS